MSATIGKGYMTLQTNPQLRIRSFFSTASPRLPVLHEQHLQKNID